MSAGKRISSMFRLEIGCNRGLVFPLAGQPGAQFVQSIGRTIAEMPPESESSAARVDSELSQPTHV
jgi:hypothetical protein